MKSAIVLALAALSCLGFSACSPGAAANRAMRSHAPVAGGYSSTGDVRDFRRAAAFAARTESVRTGTPIRIVAILKSERQVVAGMNFRLQVAAQRNGATTETADVVVYHDLLGRDHLTTWRWRRR